MSGNWLAYFTVSAVENIQWTVVFCRTHVIDIILHFHFDAVALVVFAAFEFLISVLLCQSWQRPLFICLPIGLSQTRAKRKIISFDQSKNAIAS